ncbi:hypothetical protein N6H05_13925 [Sphingobium sp. WTD-1]|uniref:hypothetical protein n=1 Tax=Sphingobium sp. WTD-1 TaxID=2979467 RepID=UPI0024DE223C|nr:hypothetical protein [Sphingobium sp. WTD-1]WIA54165.1 hypothetical protein N6H05_13925 [Sphingobium sp. WTD-1]
MDILNLVVPLVGVVGAFLLALAAIKQRTLLGFFGRGLDETKALSALPARAKLEGLEIIENTLEAVWEIGGRGCHRRICVIQALDVDAAEPGADGPDCEEDEALSQ